MGPDEPPNYHPWGKGRLLEEANKLSWPTPEGATCTPPWHQIPPTTVTSCQWGPASQTTGSPIFGPAGGVNAHSARPRASRCALKDGWAGVAGVPNMLSGTPQIDTAAERPGPTGLVTAGPLDAGAHHWQDRTKREQEDSMVTPPPFSQSDQNRLLRGVG